MSIGFVGLGGMGGGAVKNLALKGKAVRCYDLDDAKMQRAAGFGTLLITLGAEQAFRRLGCAKVSAVIKTHNLPSIKAFEKCGFEKVGTCRREETRRRPEVRC